VGESDDGEPTITFLEVNTRLQVEHPVTEAITGIDLVEMQIGVANGHALPFEQRDITFTGHAIEVRLVAEDPVRGWMPSTGTVSEFEIPGDVRVDTGFRAGSEVSSDYDSLLAKVIAHHADRGVAALRIARALRSSRITGVRTNAAALVAIMDEPDFRAGRTLTSYLDQHPEVLIGSTLGTDDRWAHFLAAVFAIERANRLADHITGFAPSGWRNLRTRGRRRRLICDGAGEPGPDGFAVGTHRGAPMEAEYVFRPPGAGSERVADVMIGWAPESDETGALTPDRRRASVVRLLSADDDAQVVEIDGVRRRIAVRIEGDRVSTADPSGSIDWQQPPRFDDHDAEEAGSGPVCPLPGTVIAVHVQAGQSVVDGQLLMVVEAMKMEHKITAHGDHMVAAVHFAVGDRVDTGDLLVGLAPAEGGAEHG
jgi:propionyl-CoA carboxylase alpha chain